MLVKEEVAVRDLLENQVLVAEGVAVMVVVEQLVLVGVGVGVSMLAMMMVAALLTCWLSAVVSTNF